MIEVLTEIGTDVVAEGDGQEVLTEIRTVAEVVTEQTVEVLTEVGPVEILIETPDPEVITETQVVVEVVEDAIQGPPGPQGLQGPQGEKGDKGDPAEIIEGTGDLSFLHEQPSASDTWTIAHNLGKYPSVTVVDSAGDECEGVTNYVGLNQVVISFSAAFAGRAFLN